MEKKEVTLLLECLRKDPEFREQCFDAIYKKDGEKAIKLLEEKGMKSISQQELSEIDEVIGQVASEDIYVWSGKYHFLKPEKLKKSVLTIDESQKEVSINGHALSIEYVSENSYHLSSSKNVYSLTFSFGEKDEDIKMFQGTILTKQDGKNENDTEKGEETEGTQEEWYETSSAEEYSFVMTIIGTFDLLLGLIILGKDCYNSHKEAPEQEKDRQDIRDTHTKLENMQEKMEELIKRNKKVSGVSKLKEKTKELADLMNEQMLSHIQGEFKKYMENHLGSQNQVDKKAVFERMKTEIETKYTRLLSQELEQYENKIKERYFDPFDIPYDPKTQETMIHEVAESTYEYFEKSELFENYYRSFELEFNFNIEQNQMQEQIEKYNKDYQEFNQKLQEVNPASKEYDEKYIELKGKMKECKRKEKKLEAKKRTDSDKFNKEITEIEQKIEIKEREFRHIRR